MRYRAIYDGNGLKAEFDGETCVYVRPDLTFSPRSDLPCPRIMRDIEPYKNMIDGRMITSRSEHRELLNRHNCVEIGNETQVSTPPAPNPDGRRELLHRQLSDVSDKQADKVLKHLKRDLAP